MKLFSGRNKKLRSFKISCLYLVTQSHYDVINSIIVLLAMDSRLLTHTKRIHS